MTNPKKQLKLTKLFKKAVVRRRSEESEVLEREVEEIEAKLKEKQNELFQLQRNSYRHKSSPTKSRPLPFIRPEKIVLESAVNKLKSDIELMSMLSGIEVQSYVAEDHCCILYHMQHPSPHQVKHGLKIDMKPGAGNIEKYSLPLGFNLQAVTDDFGNVKTPECLGAIRKALVAYYDRLNQYEALNKLISVEAQLFKIMDGSHMEVTFTAQNETEEEDVIDVTLALDYRVYDIRPKVYSFRDEDLPEGTAEVLKQQCISFKKKQLHKAFKDAFIDGCGPYKLVQQLSRAASAPRRRGAVRGGTHREGVAHYQNDDTFRPEEYSESEEDQHDQ